MSKTISKDSDSRCIRIGASIHKRLKAFCDKKGYRIGTFAENAIQLLIAEQERK